MDPTSLIIEAIAGAAGGDIAGFCNKARWFGHFFKKPAA